MLNYIFDLYGTLIDVRTDEHAPRTWKKWCKELDKRNLLHPAYYVLRNDFFKLESEKRKEAADSGSFSYPEIDIIDVYKELFEGYGNFDMSKAELEDISYAFRVASRQYIRLFPGVKEYLSRLSETGKHAYILSNAQRSYTLPEIELFGLEKLTEDILISSDFNCMKPDKAFFDALITKYNMDKSETIMHGDSMSSDIEGARNAGINHVHLAGQNNPNRYYTDMLSGK